MLSQVLGLVPLAPQASAHEVAGRDTTREPGQLSVTPNGTESRNFPQVEKVLGTGPIPQHLRTVSDLQPVEVQESKCGCLQP